MRDHGEGALAGWTVFLAANANGTLDLGEHTALTDAQGHYSFTITPGNDTIYAAPGDGWTETVPGPNWTWSSYTLHRPGRRRSHSVGVRLRGLPAHLHDHHAAVEQEPR